MSNTNNLFNERRKQSWKDGGVCATRYARIFSGIKKSTRDEDIKLHIDFWHGPDGVDVKGNNLPDEIWVEFRNVHGDLGWLLGEAKWIAFEICEVGGFVRVERQELLDWCLGNVDFNDYVLYKKDAYKKIYQRKDREDKITMLVLNDLCQLKSFEIINYKKSYIHPDTEERLVI
jgi:hypothetical protein|tara:strand:+ start:333 stop:854 length:522 start_codon:yes stop_codon:yes gene_type:complete